ncbi:MAG TPA: TolC family protein [Phycisphaerales bacterium]|nr:TolC family protein [Phycisphaerales bacterium]
MHRTLESYPIRAGVVVALAGLALFCGCENPMARSSADTLRQSVVDAARAETRQAEAKADRLELTRPTGEVSFPPERIKELDEMGGPVAYSKIAPPIGADLLGQETRTVSISIRRAILGAVQQNLDVQGARLLPAIDQARVVEAEAAFDWVFFGGVEWDSIDQPQTQTVIGGIPIGTPARVNQSVAYSTGIRKQMTSGGLFSISQGQTYNDDKTPGVAINPDPSNAAFLQLRLDQPLLRGFGSDVALAEVRLNENAERRSVYQVKATVIDVVNRTEQAYWRLVRARASVQIAQQNLNRGIETRQIVKAREGFDARPAEISDAVATVERRRSAVIRAVNELRVSSDELKALINDPEITVGDETMLMPADEALDQPISYSLLDSLTAAIDKRPEVKQALLLIDDASIRQTVADNARLPLLNLALQSRFQGLASGVGDAYEDITEGQFVNMLARVDYEVPIGNRAAEAAYRRTQLERMQATIGYRTSVQQVVLQVKEALREVQTQYQLIEQLRSSRLAAVENLRTLQVLERTIQSLTPDFLNLKFQRQEQLAQAELEEMFAITGYNIALSQLAAARGDALERNAIVFDVPDAPEAIKTGTR